MASLRHCMSNSIIPLPRAPTPMNHGISRTLRVASRSISPLSCLHSTEHHSLPSLLLLLLQLSFIAAAENTVRSPPDSCSFSFIPSPLFIIVSLHSHFPIFFLTFFLPLLLPPSSPSHLFPPFLILLLHSAHGAHRLSMYYRHISQYPLAYPAYTLITSYLSCPAL